MDLAQISTTELVQALKGREREAQRLQGGSIAIHKIKIDSNLGAVWIDEQLIKSVNEISFKLTSGKTMGEVVINMDASVEVDGEIIFDGELILGPRYREINKSEERSELLKSE